LKPLQHPHILILTILRSRLTKKYVGEKKDLYHDYNILSKDTESLIALGLLNSSLKYTLDRGV
jgi:hypothetical protein